jgi:hypothetical protein
MDSKLEFMEELYQHVLPDDGLHFNMEFSKEVRYIKLIYTSSLADFFKTCSLENSIRFFNFDTCSVYSL